MFQYHVAVKVRSGLLFCVENSPIAFGDNDQARQWTYGYLVDFAFFPDAGPYAALARQGLNCSKLYRYPGYKEDVYLADYNRMNHSSSLCHLIIMSWFGRKT